MISARDADFHPVSDENWRWTETTALIFHVGEAGIHGNLYVVARPKLGVALSNVSVAQGFCFHPYEVDFSDAQMHLPCPPNFVNYELESGIRVEVTKAPGEIHFQYEYKLGGCSLDLRFEGLHEPFDANDPLHNPMLASEKGRGFDERLGTQWGNRLTDADTPSGHFEIMGRATGHLELRGRRYAVDCCDVLDHSWSNRTETSKRAVSWISAVFGADYGIHLAVLLEIKNGRTVYEDLRFGYVMEDGALYGLVSATVEASGANFHPMNCRFVATDVRGKKHEMFGTAVGARPWYNFNPSHVAFQTLMQWHWGDRVCYAEMADIFGLEFLADRNSRHATKAK